jgi:hypothetical protein
MIEHHESMLLLVRNGEIGSAFVLARSIFESAFRGLWANFCSTDAEIKYFEHHDELSVNMHETGCANDGKYRVNGFLQDLKSRAWPALCSYTHTGLLQSGRRFTGHNVQPAYTEDEIFDATTAVTTCILLLIGKFLAVQNHADGCQAAEALTGTYGAGSSAESVSREKNSSVSAPLATLMEALRRSAMLDRSSALPPLVAIRIW